MRPPICAICKERFSPPREGGKIYFKLTEDQKAHNEKLKAPGVVGHPGGLEWFCNTHYGKAKEFRHLHSQEALKVISTYFENPSDKTEQE